MKLQPPPPSPHQPPPIPDRTTWNRYHRFRSALHPAGIAPACHTTTCLFIGTSITSVATIPASSSRPPPDPIPAPRSRTEVRRKEQQGQRPIPPPRQHPAAHRIRAVPRCDPRVPLQHLQRLLLHRRPTSSPATNHQQHRHHRNRHKEAPQHCNTSQPAATLCRCPRA